MNMHVRDLLAGKRPVVHADTEVGRIEMSAESPLHLDHPLHQSCRALGREISDVLLLFDGNDERVSRPTREDVEEGHPGIPLGDERRGNIPVDYLREQTRFHLTTSLTPRHFRLPRELHQPMSASGVAHRVTPSHQISLTIAVDVPDVEGDHVTL